MKLSCDTVRDLLPAYTGKTASATTIRLVKSICAAVRTAGTSWKPCTGRRIRRYSGRRPHMKSTTWDCQTAAPAQNLIAVLVLLAAVWAVLFTIDYARFSQGESLKFAIHSHQDYGEEELSTCITGSATR